VSQERMVQSSAFLFEDESHRRSTKSLAQLNDPLEEDFGLLVEICVLGSAGVSGQQRHRMFGFRPVDGHKRPPGRVLQRLFPWK
jgi:hypothetical protein